MVTSQSCHAFSAVQPKQFTAFTQKICLHLVGKVGKVLTCSFETRFFALFTFKMATCNQGFEADSERSYS